MTWLFYSCLLWTWAVQPHIYRYINSRIKHVHQHHQQFHACVYAGERKKQKRIDVTQGATVNEKACTAAIISSWECVQTKALKLSRSWWLKGMNNCNFIMKYYGHTEECSESLIFTNVIIPSAEYVFVYWMSGPFWSPEICQIKRKVILHLVTSKSFSIFNNVYLN